MKGENYEKTYICNNNFYDAVGSSRRLCQDRPDQSS